MHSISLAYPQGAYNQTELHLLWPTVLAAYNDSSFNHDVWSLGSALITGAKKRRGLNVRWKSKIRIPPICRFLFCVLGAAHCAGHVIIRRPNVPVSIFFQNRQLDRIPPTSQLPHVGNPFCVPQPVVGCPLNGLCYGFCCSLQSRPLPLGRAGLPSFTTSMQTTGR
jgi:hypothetical protein